MTHWYALKSRDELFTADMLREAGYAAYVPCERLSRKRGRVLREHNRPVMPGYVFVMCPEDALSIVRYIGNSYDFVRSGANQPQRIPTAHLAPIVWAETFGELDYTRKHERAEFTPGDDVRVKRGLWAGYVGQIISVGSRKTLVEIKGAKLTLRPDLLEFAA